MTISHLSVKAFLQRGLGGSFTFVLPYPNKTKRTQTEKHQIFQFKAVNYKCKGI